MKDLHCVENYVAEEELNILREFVNQSLRE